MATVYLSIGSNVAPLLYIPQALQHLKEKNGLRDISAFYESAPFGNESGPPFVNGACSIETSLSKKNLKNELKKIEVALGRPLNHTKNEPRTIDLDILLWDEEIDSLIYTRSFLSVPLFDIAPNLVLPDSGMALSLLVAKTGRRGLKELEAFSHQMQEQFAS